jgi:hypothetical protein
VALFDHLKGGVKFDQPPDPAFPPLAFSRAGSVLPPDFPRAGSRRLARPQKQKRAGSCVPHGKSYLIESYVLEFVLADFQVSIMDWYFGGRWIEGNGAETVDGGQFPSKARQWADEYGLLSATRAPYVDSQVTIWRPRPEWAADRIELRAKLEPIPVERDTILYALGVEKRVVSICHRATDGIDNIPANGNERYIPSSQRWGHCRDIDAWDLDRVFADGIGGVRLLNWWGDPDAGMPWGVGIPGTEWRDGTSWMSFNSLLAPGFVDDADRLVVAPNVRP